MRRNRTASFFLFAALLWVGSAARADEPGISGTAGVSLLIPFGVHKEASSTYSIDSTPFPVGQASARYRALELFIESLPFQGGPTRSTHPVLDTSTDFVDFVGRLYDRGDRAWIGGGEAIYDIDSIYSPYGREDRTRVAGGRYEIGTGVLRNPGRLRVWVDFMPVLHAVDHSQYPYAFRQFNSYQRGSQFEAQIAVTNAHGPVALSYGVRYLNYDMRFANGTLATRNDGILPYGTIAYRFGKR